MFGQVGAFSNLWLLGVVVFSVLMQLGMHYLPAAQAVFGSVRSRPLTVA